MKINLIKSISIMSHRFNITYDDKKEGGSFDFGTQEILIGTRSLETNGEYVFAVIMHEISEIIHTAMNTRYDEFGTMRDFKFILSHKEFQTHNFLLAEAMQKFIF